MEHCRKNLDDCVRVICPKGRTLKFNHHKNMLKAPFTLFADFECLLVKQQEKKGDKTERKAEHVPCGFRDGFIKINKKGDIF